jgi:hypothetical protein
MGQLFDICFWAFLACWFASAIIWFVWVREYIRDHGKEPASWFLFAPIQDYAAAVQIAQKEERAPWFLKLYAVFACLGLLLLITGMIATTR